MGKDHGAKGPPGVGAWGGVLELETQSLGLGLGGALGVSSVRTYRTDLSGHTELVQGFGGSGVEAAGVSKARLGVTAIETEVRTMAEVVAAYGALNTTPVLKLVEDLQIRIINTPPANSSANSPSTTNPSAIGADTHRVRRWMNGRSCRPAGGAATPGDPTAGEPDG